MCHFSRPRMRSSRVRAPGTASGAASNATPAGAAGDVSRRPSVICAAVVRAPAGADVLNGERVRALLLADLAQQLVGHRIPRRALVQIVHLVVLGRLAGGEQPVDRGDLRLQPQPQRDPHARGVRHGDRELLHSRLQPAAVNAFGLGHPPQDLGLALGHPLGDQVIHGPRHDFAAPRLEQALSDLCRAFGHVPQPSQRGR